MAGWLRIEDRAIPPTADGAGLVLTGTAVALWQAHEVASEVEVGAAHWALVDRTGEQDDVYDELDSLDADTYELGTAAGSERCGPLRVITSVALEEDLRGTGLGWALVHAVCRVASVGRPGLEVVLRATPHGWHEMEAGQLADATERLAAHWAAVGFGPLPSGRRSEVRWTVASEVAGNEIDLLELCRLLEQRRGPPSRVVG